MDTWAKSGLLFITVNEVLLKHRYFYLSIVYGWLVWIVWMYGWLVWNCYVWM